MSKERVNVLKWHPYRGSWHRDDFTCCRCGAKKERMASPRGWWKRYRPAVRQTERLCPACATRAMTAANDAEEAR